MLATSTHDTKRGEDSRARLDVLSEIPEEWEDRVRAWSRVNRRFKEAVDGRMVPSANDEYLLYQTLVGSWPSSAEPPGPDQLSGYRERIEAYMNKAVREGKESSSWRHPDEAYERALSRFIRRLLDPAEPSPFLTEFLPFQRRIAELGATNSISQLVLKLTVPGVPDTYRGCEFWDLSLVDPDNRRSVDWERRMRVLSELRAELDAPRGEWTRRLRTLVHDWWDGRLKLFVTWKLLDWRRRHSELFLEGAYEPLSARGDRTENLCAFSRELAGAAMIVVVPRLCARLARKASPFPLGRVAWGDTTVQCRAGQWAGALSDVVSGRTVLASRADGSTELAVADLFSELPLAVLIPLDETGP
jgi:(1->4)-alpha-D-glucan 1-alpha-D-glucosylmutase